MYFTTSQICLSFKVLPCATIPVPLDPFLMTQNIWPAETFFMVSEQVKFRGFGLRALPNFPAPLPLLPWHILQAMGFALFSKIFLPASTLALAGILAFIKFVGADFVFRGCGQGPLSPPAQATLEKPKPASASAINKVATFFPNPEFLFTFLEIMKGSFHSNGFIFSVQLASRFSQPFNSAMLFVINIGEGD
jgi:hypothetical protein